MASGAIKATAGDRYVHISRTLSEASDTSTKMLQSTPCTGLPEVENEGRGRRASSATKTDMQTDSWETKTTSAIIRIFQTL